MNDGFKLIAVKRKWVPEWLYAIMSHPVDLISPKWLPFRYILTEKMKQRTFEQLFQEARNSLGYHIEMCFLAEGQQQEEEAEKAIRQFIKDNYFPK